MISWGALWRLPQDHKVRTKREGSRTPKKKGKK